VISFDTNILFAYVDGDNPLHEKARVFFTGLQGSSDVCVCEQVLIELYCLVRNPSVCRSPLSAPEAVQLIQGFRSNPAWRIVDVVNEPSLMKSVWVFASENHFAYRRIFDLRLAKTLQHHGVTEFATRNLKDFQDTGFTRVWNPLA
jgi:toxin-antitoxin system PIN domain toxin